MAESFWKKGLRFECTRCSACCRHEPGFVFLSSDDIRRLLEHSRLAFRQFMDTFIKKVDIGTGYALSLKEKPNNDCILWGEHGCSAYDARPVQCSTFPFWQGVIETAADWDRESADCPGIGHGALIPAEHIGNCLWQRRAYPPLIIDYSVILETIDESTLLGSAGFPSNSLDARQA